MVSLQKYKSPELNMPKFICDKKLHSKLDDYELTSLMNKSNFTLFLGKAGSGKSSLLVSLLNTNGLFKKCYHSIYVFMPPNSRQSFRDNFFDTNLPPEQIYDGLDESSLSEVYDKIRENADDDKFSLIVLDDVQKSLKDKDIQKILLEIVNNRRHLRTSIWMACQTYNSIPRQVRQGLTNLFVFKINKTEISNIFNEQVELFRERFDEILSKIYKQNHDFLFIDTNSQRLFYKFDELIVDDD